MIVKEISKQERIRKIEALIERLPDSHPKWPLVKKELIKLLRGYKGEKAVAYYLDFLSEKDYFIFHNLRLPSGKHHFQIDFLILTLRFAIILECKNFYGTLFFDKDFKQLLRSANGEEEGFSDPISQAKWHQQQLGNWLKINKFPNMPIQYLVVISDPSTIVKTDRAHTEAKQHVVHSQILLERMEELGGRCKKEIIDMKVLRKLSKLLLKSHVPEDIDILKRYGILPSDLITGVQCPSCSVFGMERKHGTWFCPKCLHKGKDAHLKALDDYFLLINSSITNEQFRVFMHLPSIYTANRLLNSIKLPHSGTNKGRIYFRPAGKGEIISEI